MQTTSAEFLRLARGDLRPLNYKLFMSFPKNFDDDISFFEIGTSIIGGSDPIKPADSSVIQQWDKYDYTDYSDRVMSLEWESSREPIDSTTLGMADVVLSNYDDLFTPGSDPAIGDYILPYRPIRILAGFGEEVIPAFIGLTEGMPVIDEKAKTATFHCLDFMSAISRTPLQESEIYENTRVDEIISGLFVLAGLSSLQLELEGASTVIPFAYYKKDQKLGDALMELIEVEQGYLYMDEAGVIRFKTRQDFDETVRETFTAHINIIDAEVVAEDDVINVVEVKGRVREVQPLQLYWELPAVEPVEAGDSVEIWADFQDPVTSIVTPVALASAVTSYYRVNKNPDNTGATSTDLTLTASELFGTSYKMTFTNAGSTTLFLTELQLYATPATVTEDIYAREEDETSVAKFDERLHSVQNDFFQSNSDAASYALVLLDDYSEYGQIKQLEVKGNMALQVDDTVKVNLYDNIGEYKITRIQNRLDIPPKFTQKLKLKSFTRREYFTIGVSRIGGTDAIRP